MTKHLRACVRGTGYWQDPLERMWGLVDVAPKPPVVALCDGARVVVRIAGTSPTLGPLTAHAVEVQQDLRVGTVTVSPLAQDVELARVAPRERLRLRWKLAGDVDGPWSAWTHVVSLASKSGTVCPLPHPSVALAAPASQ